MTCSGAPGIEGLKSSDLHFALKSDALQGSKYTEPRLYGSGIYWPITTINWEIIQRMIIIIHLRSNCVAVSQSVSLYSPPPGDQESNSSSSVSRITEYLYGNSFHFTFIKWHSGYIQINHSNLFYLHSTVCILATGLSIFEKSLSSSSWSRNKC